MLTTEKINQINKDCETAEVTIIKVKSELIQKHKDVQLVPRLHDDGGDKISFTWIADSPQK